MDTPNERVKEKSDGDVLPEVELWLHERLSARSGTQSAGCPHLSESTGCHRWKKILFFIFPHGVPFRASSSIDENMKYLTGKCWTTRVLEALFLGDVVLGDHFKSGTLIQQANKGARGAVSALDNLPIIQPPSMGAHCLSLESYQ